ncbi:sugar ABC transporter ATP-binding protein [Falsibacillus albus]|uniref:Sugar ABC transporter ATP-binding protein n=1 Tax=Falsibacillus albus TaxID=2478915 RepID=A0A3L7JS28_9BACI|nr:sugar ABC transporter ATP-binding protein [Falsibacillus albus]RLQ93486.1 sugar ABC transporter ATP-binding protein [Falsibacillus albus]
MLLKMKNIHKSFSGVKALAGAHFEVREGEVHALLGANGAGKSTLMKILAGVYQIDSGTIEIRGREAAAASPRDALEAGVHCVYQEVDTAIVPELTVLDNLMLNQIVAQRKWFLSKKGMKRAALGAWEQLNGTHIPLDEKAEHLSLADKQLLLIARAVIQNAKIVILDEPTAPLSMEETERLVKVIEILKKNGVGCIFISHRLPEVFAISDRLTVMRDGKTISTHKTDEVEVDQVIQEMLGKELQEKERRFKRKISEQLLSVKEISDGENVKNVSFSIGKGEVVGIAGLVGAGKTELAKLLFGAAPLKSGEIILHERKVHFRSPADAIRSKIVLVPEERRKEGLFLEESLIKNITFPNLKRFSSSLFFSKEKERFFTEKVISDLNIKANSTKTEVKFLSGGNQQKVVIGKWFSHDADLMVFDEPTKGVDVGAKQEIFQIIEEFASQGKSVIYCSCEMAELLKVADRILVMFDGEIVKELANEDATQEKLLLYASGGKEEQHEGKVHSLSI